jgi:DNA-binding MarR family transcriptional regulator
MLTTVTKDSDIATVGLAFLLSQVGAHAAIGFAERLNPLDLKPYDAGILRTLGRNPGLTQQALSAMLGMFPSRLVVLLDGLEHHKLVERRPSRADRRIYRLYLTRAGRAALSAIGRLTLQLEDDLLAALSARERTRLRGLLTRIVAQQKLTPGVHPSYREIALGETTSRGGSGSHQGSSPRSTSRPGAAAKNLSSRSKMPRRQQPANAGSRR